MDPNTSRRASAFPRTSAFVAPVPDRPLGIIQGVTLDTAGPPDEGLTTVETQELENWYRELGDILMEDPGSAKDRLYDLRDSIYRYLR